jgi:hypothetical protein
LPCRREKVLKYPGIKEDVYVGRFVPSATMLGQLGVSSEDVLVTARPPASEAHYHSDRSDQLFARFMKRACQERTERVRVVFLPRNRSQRAFYEGKFPEWFSRGQAIIPDQAVDGLNLLWNSDLVVGGGGTMNREAASLGVPVYTLFRGPMGAVDTHLRDQGRLAILENEADVDQRIIFQKRVRTGQQSREHPPALETIIRHLEAIIGGNS